MGLYSLACAALNKDVHEYIDSLFTDFHNAANESRLANFAVFFPQASEFKIILNKGFNAETVRKSVSTADFWNGMIHDDSWHFIRGETLTPFFQLFSAYDAVFDCLSIKKSSYQGTPFIFMAVGEFSDIYLQKQLDSFLPFIGRTYAVLNAFYKPVSVLHNNADFLAQAKECFKSGQASLYIIKLNKLFESLFALLCPSDFDFITSCIAAAAGSLGAAPPLCLLADDESCLYMLIQDKKDTDFHTGMKNIFKNMFSQKRAEFMQTESASADSPFYSELAQDITLNR